MSTVYYFSLKTLFISKKKSYLFVFFFIFEHKRGTNCNSFNEKSFLIGNRPPISFITTEINGVELKHTETNLFVSFSLISQMSVLLRTRYTLRMCEYQNGVPAIDVVHCLL